MSLFYCRQCGLEKHRPRSLPSCVGQGEASTACHDEPRRETAVVLFGITRAACILSAVLSAVILSTAILSTATVSAQDKSTDKDKPTDKDKTSAQKQDGPFRARLAPNRAKMVARHGGTPESEKAVASALKWLAGHQATDGGWSFDHGGGACRKRCSHRGSLGGARIGATGMALLPFLGAGQTSSQGEYRKTVKRGLNYLVEAMKVEPGRGGSLRENQGHLYSHALATMALCEASAMTRDRGLARPAQLAIDYVAYAQDPVGGGWRYMPRQAGDTSVLGWQLAALKTGQAAGLQVPAKVFQGASRFLDSVSAVNGAQYGYTSPQGRPATSAIGLLSRMYLGWPHDHKSLRIGTDMLSALAPSQNMYFSFYVNQVMWQLNDERWPAWNTLLRDQLVASQSTDGHAAGSWFLGRDHGARGGGRLYCTCMATMMLQVYYRHPPIYKKDNLPAQPDKE